MKMWIVLVLAIVFFIDSNGNLISQEKIDRMEYEWDKIPERK